MTFKYFSPAENAFYAAELVDSYMAAGTWPDDAAKVEDALYRAFIAEPPAGQYRGVNEAGMPCWLDIPAPSQDELVTHAESMRQQRIDEANVYINSRQWPGKAAIGRLRGEELAQYNLWLDYLDALEATEITAAPDIRWPEPPVN